jgi:hypothetical protein
VRLLALPICPVIATNGVLQAPYYAESCFDDFMRIGAIAMEHQTAFTWRAFNAWFKATNPDVMNVLEFTGFKHLTDLLPDIIELLKLIIKHPFARILIFAKLIIIIALILNILNAC